MIAPNSVILFQGDSVTDGGRTGASDPSSALGSGYPKKVKEYIDIFCQNQNLTVINRGVSGNRVVDLQNRWDEDCIALKPDVVSILIGVNDTWRKYDCNDETPAELFEERYRDLLTRTRKALDCQIVLLEPFVIPADSEKIKFYDDLIWKIQAIRKLSREFCCQYIPLDGIFASSCVGVSPSVWSEDGIHPTDAGHSLIAKLWIDMLLN